MPTPRKPKTLAIEHCDVKDLRPIVGLPLEALFLAESQVEDYGPLRDLPLKTLGLDYDPELHRDLLRSIPTLQTIHGKPAAVVLDNPSPSSLNKFRHGLPVSVAFGAFWLA